MKDLYELECRMMAIDEAVRPIATRKVDITNPDWANFFGQRKHPLDEVGVRVAAEALLEELIGIYRTAGEDVRVAIRNLFSTCRYFTWASSLSAPPTNGGAFRNHLIVFSMRDQGRDSRDELLGLQDLCRTARAAGVETAPILHEVAALSSDENRYGMGSTRSMLNGG